METFTNLGPIVDMCVVDLERQGQGQVRGSSQKWIVDIPAHSNRVLLGLSVRSEECPLKITFKSLTH